MDENKLKVLKDIEYKIRLTCGNCSNFGTNRRNQVFGVCITHIYRHKKHTETVRQLSVHRDGYCSEHESAPHHSIEYGAFNQFREK